MRNILIKKIGLLLFGIAIVLSSSLYFNLIINIGTKRNITASVNEDNYINKNLKAAIISGAIHIDNNWSAAEIAGICTGNGSYSNPYVIEDLVIDGGGSGICISIANTITHFKITNCTVFSSGGSAFSNFAGIVLSNVSYGKITNNSCIFNYYGIYLDESTTNNITGNNVAYSTLGIYINRGEFNTVSSNNISHANYGIHLFEGRRHRILRNKVFSNSLFGIHLEWAQSIIILENDVINSNVGISIQYSYDARVSRNLVNECAQGIFLNDSPENIISENFVSGNLYNGIRLSQSWRNIILGNIVTNNTLNGIFISYNSNSNNISENIATKNEFGIHFLSSDDNIVSGNELGGNHICISETDCNYNIFYNNTGCNYPESEVYEEIPPNLTFIVNFILILGGISVLIIMIVIEIRKIRKSK